MICQGKITVMCNQQYQVDESCSSCFHLQIPAFTKLFASGKPIKIIQICKMPLKQNIISYISVWQTLQIFQFLISENDFINFFLFQKTWIISKTSWTPYKSLALANIPTEIEMNVLVRFEVIQISSFSERQLISRKFTADVHKASAESQSLSMCPEFILQWTSLFQNIPRFCSLTIV